MVPLTEPRFVLVFQKWTSFGAPPLRLCSSSRKLRRSTQLYHSYVVLHKCSRVRNVKCVRGRIFQAKCTDGFNTALSALRNLSRSLRIRGHNQVALVKPQRGSAEA
eukprot:scaffold71453_cov30-Tisochrysis_lutea.AAC.1